MKQLAVMRETNRGTILSVFSRSPILSLTDATALRPLVMHSDKRTPNQFKSRLAFAENCVRIESHFPFSDFMLNKDKADEAEADLGAIKNERSLYIPRAVIKRPKNIHLMPFGDGRMATVAARNGEVAHSLFYVVLNQPPVSVDSNEMRFTRLNEKIPITLQSATS